MSSLASTFTGSTWSKTSDVDNDNAAEKHRLSAVLAEAEEQRFLMEKRKQRQRDSIKESGKKKKEGARGGEDMYKRFSRQKFSKIRKACTKKGELFDDPEFPASTKSLFSTVVDNSVEWLRPKELCKVPQFINEGLFCQEVICDDRGSAWFVPACTALALVPRLMAKVVPDAKTQGFDEKAQYAGIFHFSIWRFGRWVDVVVDDRLPAKDGKPLYAHCKSQSTFWLSLLQKAYAKIFGDYEALSFCNTSDALVDFTGGLAQHFNIANIDIKDEAALDALCDSLTFDLSSDDSKLMTCLIKRDPDDDFDSVEDRKGLLANRSYVITAVKFISVPKSLQGGVGKATMRMVRIYNPWVESTWTGDWSDKAPQWKTTSAASWDSMGLGYTSEREFWMMMRDFATFFTNVDICYCHNTQLLTTKKTWSVVSVHSKWTNEGRNGGNVVDSPTFFSNPQILFDITDPSASVFMSLEQHDLSPGGVPMGPRMNTIGFYILRVEKNRTFRIHKYPEVVGKTEFVKMRNAFLHQEFTRGRYIVIPCCTSQDDLGHFLFRFVSGSKITAHELVKDCPERSCWNCCGSDYIQVISVCVEEIQGLNDKVATNPYVVIKCRKEKVESEVCKNTQNPHFHHSAVFYRKDIEKEPIIVEVHNHNKLIDNFVSQAIVEVEKPATDDIDEEKMELSMTGRKKEAKVQKPGSMQLRVRFSNKLDHL